MNVLAMTRAHTFSTVRPGKFSSTLVRVYDVTICVALLGDVIRNINIKDEGLKNSSWIAHSRECL